MKAKILDLLDQEAALLDACAYEQKAEWFRGKCAQLEQVSQDSVTFKLVLREIHGILGGMGSFSDLPLCPEPGTKLSGEEARARKWELTDALSTEIERLLELT